MKPILFATIISAVCILACNNAANEKKKAPEISSYEKLDSAAWLLGNWFNSSKDGNATEIWKKANDSTYKAESFVIAGKDTVFYESVDLAQRNNAINYVVSVKNQNNEAPVSFTLTSSDASTLVFENPQHDFPSKITYTKITSDSLYAEISGTVKGEQRKEGFPFKRTAMPQ